MAGFDVGVIEVVARIVRHAEAFHHSLRAKIQGCGEGDDFVPVERTKGKVEGGAFAPSVAYPQPQFSKENRQPISCAGVKGRWKGNVLQSDDAGERRAAAHLNRPPAIAVAMQLLANRGWRSLRRARAYIFAKKTR